MPELSELIREYGGLLVQESRISERKQRLRAAIAEEMARRNLKATITEHGSVSQSASLKLVIKRPHEARRRTVTPANARSVNTAGEEIMLMPV